MEKTLKQNNDKTNPVLLNARSIVKEYSEATGAKISIHDHNYEPIKEDRDVFPIGESFCPLCTENQNPSANLCREMHINAIKEGQRLGTAYTYACPLGFVFWTSPIFLNGRFTGALLGGGLIKEESQKIKALTELMFICTQSISTGSDGFNKAAKRRGLHYSMLSEKIEELKTQYPKDSHRMEYPLDKEQKFLDALAARPI